MKKNLAIAALFFCNVARAESPKSDAEFDQLVDEYYAGYPAAHPTAATELGLHQQDRALEDYSPNGIATEHARLKWWQTRWSAIAEKNKLSPGRNRDLRLVKQSILSQLVELDDVQGYRRLPDFYSGLASRTVYCLIKRDFAPAEKRIESVIARQEKIPLLLAAGKHNLGRVSKVAVDVALEEIPSTIDFFEKDVPLAFVGVKDETKKARLTASTEKAVSALKDYEQFIKEKLAPHADGPIAIGETTFRKKLFADEMVDAPTGALLASAEMELQRLQNQFHATAKLIDPQHSFRQVQEEMTRDHSTPENVIVDVQARLGALRQFLVDHKIVSLPNQTLPKVQETPPFMRAMSMASMETPGPFETHSTDAFYSVTLPEKGWKKEQVEDYMRGAFNQPLLDVVSIHEAFPGHYVQFIWLPHVKSTVRKFESAASNAEGWAHYCEQMLLDEGFGSGDAKLRLGQLQDALLRAARYVVSIRMHTRDMSFDEAKHFFHDQGYQSEKVAEMEAKRGTEDPTYLYYTFGKLEVLRLREDYKKKMGKKYSLQKFHDAFLLEGAMPLPLVREALLQ